MGAEILRQQGSVALYDNKQSRFMWGLFHFLDFDRHRHKKKMLPYKRPSDEKPARGTKALTIEQDNSPGERELLLNKETSLQVEDKNATKKSSSGAHLMTLLYKKLIKRKDRKMKNSSSAARLLRTLSIHYLECDDYVLPDEMAAQNDSLVVEQNSQGIYHCASGEKVCGTNVSVSYSGARKLGADVEDSSLIPPATEKSLQDLDNGKIVLDHSAELEQKIRSIIKEEHRISMDGVLDKIPFGHALADDDNVEKEESRGGNSRSKFGSEGFVSNNSKLAHRSIQRSRSLTASLERYSGLLESVSVREPERLPRQSNSVGEQGSNSAQAKFPRSRSLSESLDRYSHLLEFITVGEPQRLHPRLNSVKEQESKLSQGRVLRSHSLSESFDRYHLLESISVREPQRLRQTSNSVKERDNSLLPARVVRSRSLSESFENYHLLESISAREPQRLPQRSSSVKDNSFGHRRVLRSRSLSDSFDGHPVLLEPVSVREPKRPERLTSIREEGSSQDRKSQIASETSRPEPQSSSYSNDAPTEVSSPSPKTPDSRLLPDDVQVDPRISSEQNALDILVKIEESMETDTFVEQNAEINSSLEQPDFTNEHDQSEAGPMSDDQNTDDRSSISHNENETETNKDVPEEPQKASPVSVLDSYTISPQKHAELQGSKLQFDYEEHDCMDGNSRMADVELIKAEPDNERMETDTGDINHCYAQEEAEFNFVRNVLKKSGFGGGAEDFLAVWCSSYEPVDQLLFVDDLETAIKDGSSDVYIDHRLIFDLINEVLLEIYETTVANSIRLSHYSSRIRPVPMGDHLLEEVWAKVSWHLSLQQDTNHTIEHVEAQDYEKKSGWMNLQWDAESVGNYLGDLIYDSLVDEFILDFVDV